MNIVLVMSDKETGEILWHKSVQYACNFVKGDAGRALIGRMVDSAIKGARLGEHKFINCSIDLHEPNRTPDFGLPFKD